jgi:hypothetical protein
MAKHEGNGTNKDWPEYPLRTPPRETHPDFGCPEDDDRAAPGGGRGRGKPARRPPEPYRPFPVHCLPSVLARFVNEASAAMECDPAYLALPALAVCAGLIGNSRVLRIKSTWSAVSVLWAVTVSDSGTMKTPAMKLVLAPVFDLERRFKLTHQANLAEHKVRHDAWAARKKQHARDAKDAKDVRPFTEPEPETPRQKRLLTNNITIERLSALHDDNPRGLTVYSDELRGWMASFTRYGGPGTTDLPHWLSMHSAGPMLIDRKTGNEHLHIERAATSVIGTIQPGILLRALTEEHRDAGLAARLLMAMPPRRKKVWTEAEIDPRTLECYTSLLESLSHLDLRSAATELVPVVLTMDDDAKRSWVAFFREWAREQEAAEGEVASMLSKLEEGAARLALVHHVVTLESRGGDDPDEPARVGEKSITAGVEMAKWFAAEARRIYAMLREDDGDRQVRRLIDFLRGRGGRCTTKELQRSSSRYKTSEDAEADLQSLVDDGLAEWQPRSPGTQGGRRTRDCVLIQVASDETDETDETTPSG